MSKKKPAYAELQARLAQAEALLDALRRGEMDTLLGPSGPLKIRLQALIEENERLAREWQTTFDIVQDAIWVLDADQRILRANKAAEEVFGCPLAEMPGRNCFDVAHHTDEPIPGCPFCLMRVSRQRESFEMQLGERWFEVTTDPILGENGNLIGAVHIASDITERKQTEARTEHLNRVLRAIRDVNQLITHEQDRDALLRRACEILISTRGYRSAWAALRGEDGAAQMVAESGIGADFAPVRQALARGDWPPCCRQAQERPDGIALIHDPIRNCTTCPLAHVYRDTAALAGALRYGGRDYGMLVVALPAGLADDPEEQLLFRELVGDVAYALHAIELAQARKKAEEALRESEEKYRSLFNQSVEGIYLHDLEGRVLEVNEMACAQSGYTREEWLCRTVFDGHPGKSTTNLPKDEILRMWKEWVPGQRYTVEAEHQRKDGTVYPVEISTGIVRYKGGNAILAIVKDITARKQAEEQLRAAHAELQRLLDEAEQSRRALLSLVEDQKATEQALRESEERLRRRLTELTILYESSRVFAQLLSPASVAQQMIDTLSQHMSWHHIAIRQKRPASDELELLAFNQPGLRPENAAAVRQRMQSLIQRVGQGLSGYAVQVGQTIRTGDVTRYPQYIETYPGIRSGLYAPMKIGDEVTGVIAIESEEADAFSEDDERLLTALANQSAVAIENARLFEAERAGRQRVEILYRLGLALAQTLNLPTIYRVAYEHIAQLVECPIFGISRYDPTTQTLRAEYMLEEGEPLDPAIFPPLHVGPDLPLKGRVRAIHAQQPEIVSCLPTPASAQVLIVGRSDEEHIPRSALYVPIVVQGQTTGLLEVQSYRENAYSEAEVALLGPVASQIGLAIENAQLFADLEAERNSLAQRVRERTAQLEAANKELEAFAYSVSHDLRAPLRALDGFSAALFSQYGEQLDEQGRHYLERIRLAAQRMGELIQDLLDLSRVSRREISRQAVDLSALAREIAAELQAQAPQRQAEFVIAEGLTAYGDVTLLRLMLENLLGNAWKFTATRERAYIEFGAMGEGEAQPLPVYYVRDNGVGFDMAYADKLFAPFQRLHSQSEFPGTGIGLATVQRIAARHGGKVWAEAAPDRGATFYFTLGD